MKRFQIVSIFRLFTAVSVLSLLVPVLLCAQPETEKPPATKPAELPWLDDLAAAYREAALKQRPIFVRVGGAGCGWCTKLEKEIVAPEVQAELKRWTLVYLDLDRHPAEVRRLAVGPIPALRVLTHTGRVVQASDGYREAADLVKWLQPQFTAAMAAPDAALLSSGPPNLAETLRLVRVFGDRDPLLREAAIRRLLPHPSEAREDVVAALQDGSLAAKLSALELLGDWKAPVKGLDPWRPETLTPENLKPLDDWLKAALPVSATTAAKELYAKEVKSLKDDLALLVTTDEANAAVLRERIARIGDVAIPFVHEALATAATDREHERLLALRYRLVSPADLTLRWPGGLERLSSRDVKQRHQAADELAQFSLPELQPLLLELFSDPDPLVRELALRGLRQLGGKRATTALVKLLNDPEPNVRAAVLKQIAEDAQADMLTQVGEYVAREKDADLVVHAVRYLREVKKPESVAYLLPLLDHDSWQVRAEAAEGIGKILEEGRYGSSGSAASPAVLEKLRSLLSDSDSFVVSRAAKALPKQYTEKTVDALLRVAESQPTLAREIVEQVASYSADKSVALPKLLPFLENPRHEVRAAAIGQLVDLQDKETESRLIRALGDKEATVRIAAADAFVERLQNARPYEEQLETLSLSKVPSPAGDASPTTDEKTAEESAQDQWLRALYDGKHRPKWTASLLPPLQQMIGSQDPNERATAARALIPLGQLDAVWPVLLAAAPLHPEAYAAAMSAQHWLVADKRLEMFRELAKLAKNDDQLSSLFHTASSAADLRIADEIWKLLDRPALSQGLSSAAHDAFRPIYLGSRYWDLSELSDKAKAKAAAAIEPHAQTGSPLKRLVAIDLLLSIAPDAASGIAEALLKDEQAPADLRRDAFQILLLTLDNVEREKRAIAILTEGNKERSLTALRLLILGPQSLAALPATKFTLDLDSTNFSQLLELRVNSGNGVAPIIPQPPKQLTVEQIRPLTEDADEEVAAYAGYLLALLGEPAGLKPLLAYWHGAKPDAACDRLVYRAIAVSDDAAYLGQLRTIYARLSDDEAKGEFYWTIRIMSGDEVLTFRDQIRKEVGMEKLKNTQRRFSY